jgi:hypothetical protein
MIRSEVEEHSSSPEVSNIETQPDDEEESDTRSSNESEHEDFNPTKAKSVRFQEDIIANRATRPRV